MQAGPRSVITSHVVWKFPGVAVQVPHPGTVVSPEQTRTPGHSQWAPEHPEGFPLVFARLSPWVGSQVLESSLSK